MLTILAVIAVVLAAAIAAVLIYAATKPDTFTVRRETQIRAAPDKIFPFIDDLRAHSAWSPFEKDPAMKRTHSGALRGKGAVYEWDGNRQVGSGRIAITDSMPPAKVIMALDMFRPFAAHNTVEFTLEPSSGGTRVSWAMKGGQPYMAKVMSTLINCDKMVGGQFEEGLAKLKGLVESAPAVAA